MSTLRAAARKGPKSEVRFRTRTQIPPTRGCSLEGGTALADSSSRWARQATGSVGQCQRHHQDSGSPTPGLPPPGRASPLRGKPDACRSGRVPYQSASAGERPRGGRPQTTRTRTIAAFPLRTMKARHFHLSSSPGSRDEPARSEPGGQHRGLRASNLEGQCGPSSWLDGDQ